MVVDSLNKPYGLPLKDFFSLVKMRLSAVVLFTAACGALLADGSLAFWRLLTALFAISGVVGAANILNCYSERFTDSLMRRTANRPLPAGRVSAQLALVLGLVLAFVSLSALYVLSNALTCLLGFIALMSYVWLYTPMKRLTAWGVVMGTIPGAMPPLMGYTLIADSLDRKGLFLFVLLAVWQLAHFLAIAVHLQEDYARAGLKVVPLVCSYRQTVFLTLLAAILLLLVSLLPLYLPELQIPRLLWRYLYAWGVCLLGGLFVALVASGFVRSQEIWSKSVFLASLLHLTSILSLLLLGIYAK